MNNYLLTKYKNVEKIVGVQFSLLSPEEIKNRSVADLKNPSSTLKTPNSVYDETMGPLDSKSRCKTCLLYMDECPGHFGHIDLVTPIHYIQFLEIVRKILYCICYRCGSLLVTSDDELTQVRRIKKPSKRHHKIIEIMKKHKQRGQTCVVCNIPQPSTIKTRKETMEITVSLPSDKEATDTSNRNNRSSETVLSAEYLSILFRKIKDEDCRIMGFDPQYSRPEWLICSTLPVCPTAVRPAVKMDNGITRNDEITNRLIEIIKKNNELRESDKKISYYMLQYYVTTMIDNEHKTLNQSAQPSGKPLKSIRKRLKGKEGRIRTNLMGKRVDYSARTVITPDPLLKIDELGVPIEMCKTLTFPEIVNDYNIDKLRQLVRRGDRYPGVKSIEQDGHHIHLRNLSPELLDMRALKIQNGDIIHRHLLENDVVLFNRQPSLHKMNMMAHRIRPTISKSFRLCVDVTKPYNADFDGDEMNMFVPQTIESLNELKELAAVPHHIISPATVEAIIHVVQDSLSGIYLLSKDRHRYEKGDVMNMLMHCSRVTLQEQPLKQYGKEDILGMISSNRFDKNRILNNEEIKKLVHHINNDIGPYFARDFIDNIRFFVTYYLLYKGFSVGIEDLLLGNKKDHAKFIEETKEASKEILENVHNTTKRNSEVEFEINKVLTACEGNIKKIYSENSTETNIHVMQKSGSKGNEINYRQMAGCVGKQTVDDGRVPYGFIDRTLPYFSKYDDSPEARGFVYNSFLKGLNPQEFFFHAMSGRIGLIDTAVKTAESGYIQRKIVKTLEDLRVYYDYTVRDVNGNIIQFTYGGDGFNPSKLYKIQSKSGKSYYFPVDFENMIEKYKSKEEEEDGSINIGEENEKIIKYAKDNRCPAHETFEKLVKEFLTDDLKFNDTTLWKEILFMYIKSFIDPGEMVGVLAAQSIGEPSTQLTLNTFHMAGVGEKVNIILGVPRLNELLNCTENMKNPSMSITLKKNDLPESFFVHTRVRDVIHKSEIRFQGQWMIFYYLDENMLVNKEMDSFDVYLALNEKIRANDSIYAKIIKSIKYDILQKLVILVFSNDNGKSQRKKMSYIDYDGDMPYDQLHHCKLYDKSIQEIIIRGFEGISYAVKSESIIQTSGSNLKEILECDHIDISNTTTNNITEINHLLGIEATRQALFEEFNQVFQKVGGINYRHIMVLIDAMTCTGYLVSVDRHGTNRGDIGPLAKCSFEESDQMLYQAAAYADFDNLQGVSSNIMLGQVPPCGTGSVSIFHDEKHMDEIFKDSNYQEYVKKWKKNKKVLSTDSDKIDGLFKFDLELDDMEPTTLDI